MSTAFLLMTLAAVDTFCLCVGLLHKWLSHVADWDIRLINDTTCRLHVFLTYLSVHVSAWTLVLITAERSVTLLFPLRAAKLCSRCRVAATWLVIVLILTCANSYVHVGNTELTRTMVNDTMDVNVTMEVMELIRCDLKDQDGSSFLRSIRLWGDLILSCLVPSLIIVLGNVIVVFKLAQVTRKRRSMQSNRLQMNAFHVMQATEEQTGLIESMRQPMPKRKQKKKKSVLSVAFMLLTVSSVFLLTTLPINIYLIWEEYIARSEQSLEYTPPLGIARSELVFTVLSLAYYANNAVNFMLYFISSSLFRDAAIKRFSCTTKKQNMTISIPPEKAHAALEILDLNPFRS